jgi:hypothetical protein
MLRTAALVVLLLALTAGSASAAPIKECGGYDPGVGFVSGDPDGAGVYNITARVVACRTARSVVARYYNQFSDYCGNGPNCQIDDWTCRTRSLGIEYADTRCTRSRGRVVRFQHGA